MKTRKEYLTNVALAFAISFFWMLILIIPAMAGASSIQTDADRPYRVEEFNISTPGDLEVRTSGGHISVEATTSNRVRVEMYVRRNGRDLMPEDTDLNEFDIEIARTGNKVVASATRKNNRGWNNWGRNTLSISFVVYAPREMSTDLKTSGGHIDLIGFDGTQRVSTSGGHLNLKSLTGVVDARTSGGHIEIDSFQGEMNARTSGGHIEAANTEGILNVRTSGGHIELADVSGTVEASTSGGSISADLRSIGQSVSLRTSGGHVSVTVPDGIGLDLDLRGSRVRTDLKNFTGQVERDEVYGTVNGGGPKLTARTSGGTVRVTFR